MQIRNRSVLFSKDYVKTSKARGFTAFNLFLRDEFAARRARADLNV